MAVADEIITSRSNPLVKRLRALKDGAAHGGLALLEGPKLVEEALAAGLAFVEGAVTPRATEGTRTATAVAALEARGVPVRRVDARVLAFLSEAQTSQGLVALVRRPEVPGERMFTGRPLVLVAVAVQDPGNLGGLLRTAEAAGATGAYVTTGSADAFSWKALRGSMGSAFRLPLRQGLRVEEVLGTLRRRGLRTVAADAEGATTYDAADLRGPVAFLVGNEGAGLPREAASAADVRVRIPMHGAVESLNVGVAAALLLYEAARQRRDAAADGSR